MAVYRYVDDPFAVTRDIRIAGNVFWGHGIVGDVYQVEPLVRVADQRFTLVWADGGTATYQLASVADDHRAHMLSIAGRAGGDLLGDAHEVLVPGGALADRGL